MILLLCVVIPAYNEEARIGGIMAQVLRLQVDLVVPVVNGCTDRTLEIVQEMPDSRIWPLYYPEPLGLDVPRCAGARLALQKGAQAVLFVDGDLAGDLGASLWELLVAIRHGGADLALTDCYHNTDRPRRGSMAGRVYATRLELNRVLGRPDLGPALPSHGPSAVSRRLLEQVPLWSLGMPPLLHALAIGQGLRAEVATRIPHRSLGSAPRLPAYRKRVAHTILGDCHAAMAAARGRPLTREDGQERLEDLHLERRWDLLGLQPSFDLGATPVGVGSQGLRTSATPSNQPPTTAAASPARRRRRRRHKSHSPDVGTIPSQPARAGQVKRGGPEHAGTRIST